MAGTARPFYGEYAWAFDLLIDRPVAKECAAIAGWLVARGVVPGARLLDAGCGTGRYAIELGRRGYFVEGVDQSPELIDVVKRSAIHQPSSVSFHVGDVLALPEHRYDAILCRGVLNDFVSTGSREAVFSSFAGALRRAGVLILDVREWDATKDRKQREPLFRKSVDTDRGKLTFTSITELDPERQQLLLSERHTLVNDAGEHSSDYRFVMRCWTGSELESVSVGQICASQPVSVVRETPSGAFRRGEWAGDGSAAWNSSVVGGSTVPLVCFNTGHRDAASDSVREDYRRGECRVLLHR